MQSTRLLRGDALVELLALDLSNLELERAGLPRAISTGKGTRTPGATTVDLLEVGELGERLGVSQGHVDDAVVSEGGHGREAGRLLAAALGAGGDEEAGKLAPEAAAGPLLASLVPESFPLGRKVAVTGGDANEEGVVLLEDGRVVEDGDVCGLGGGVHLGEDFLGECLGNSVEELSMKRIDRGVSDGD